MTMMTSPRRAGRRTLVRAAILASTCIPGTALAGEITGIITDVALDRPVRGATVSVDGSAMAAATDANGRYVLYDVDAGEHTLTVSQPGYASETLQVTVPETGKVNADGHIALATDIEGDSILVTGARASRLLAIQRKRAMPVVADVVSSDGIGKLPDYNTAEALQRLPGISVEIDQSEPRYVVIRGVDPNLNLVTVDGNVAGIPEAEGRRVALDTIPSDLVGAIEVVKTVTPDYDANAIGGAINIVTPSAYDHSKPFTYFSARGIYGSKADKTGFGASAMHGQTFGDDNQFGIVVGVSYSKRFIDSQLVDPLSWEEVADGVWAPTGMRMFNYSIMRERIGGIANLEWRPNDDVRVYVNTIYNEFTDHEGRDQFDYDMYRGTATISGNEVTYNKGRATREFRQNNQTQKLYNISPGVDWRFGTFELKLNYTYAHAQEHTPVRDDIEFRSAGDKVSTILLGSSMPTFSSVDETLYDAAAFPLRRIRLRRETINEDLHALKADLKADFADGTDSFMKFGVKFTDRTKDRDNYQELWTPAQSVTFADTGAALDPIQGFFDGKYDFGPAMDYNGVMDYAFVQNPGLMELDEEATAFNDKASDYHINEQIYAAYGMASLEFGDLTVIGGVRVEHTSGKYDAFAIRDTDGDGTIEVSDIQPLGFKKEYTHVLPNITLNYRPSPEMVFRAAWTNTIGRPNYSDVVPTFEEEDGAGSSGNPYLKPYTSMGLDLSAEYYPDADTVFALAAFYKHIKNPIYTQTIYDTAFAGVDLISLSQPQNANSGNLFGIEANMTTRLTFLPAPLDGFGISANVTYVDSSVDVPGREDDDLPFFRQSKWLAGGALFYEKGPFEARFAVSYRDAYLTGVGASTDFDSYTKGRTVLDARIGYRILEGVEVFGSVSNIGEEPLVGYQGYASRVTSREEYGVNVDFGVSAKF
ncbi:TonB-dependent receptor [Novosphingobium album (ex Hu et al. 2023)]|uniref:TonB-dependent receptor n=1 Tax=Novosphingobium album (ex Hu et al. 2023) TaxID=2930093 RepID=A0ABT0B026_9SPHN|nr:TonB-dependent receptor [Novosphingobium album (ex Hu et al. 2023)]MCJ2178412.1 TonB-dependent receptor [Novosphingobium album (ex Hu et al. 2023)]